MAHRFHLSGALQLIDGDRRAGSGDTVEDHDPATSELLVAFASATAADVDDAVTAARRAQPGWAARTPVERGRVLRRVADLLREHNEELAHHEVLDTGKPVRESIAVDALSGAECFEFYGGIVAGMAGEHHQLGTLLAYTRREPLGVIGAIGAWNYPLQIACWKAAPALAAGNAVVFKPSELTPVTAVALGELLLEAGLPPGVFSVVQGGAATGEALTAHPDIDALSLTGSVPTGRAVMRAAATGPKPVILELGGKSPVIVRADADLDRAVTAAVLANFATQGEVCTNGTRVFVHRDLHDEFLERFAAAAEELVVGDPLDPATQVGSLISDDHLAKVLAAIDAGVAGGARLVIGGRRRSDGSLARGRFVEPTVFAEVADDSRLACEEIFGPVASVMRVEDDDEALRRANATPYGLAAGVVTADLDAAHRLAAQLDAGLVWVNTYNVTPVEVPFGGIRASGLGRENGWAGLHDVTRTKTVMIESGPLEGL